MAYATYTKELVIQTAEALIAEGIKPTISNVRERMGGGSPNDITKWMKEFNVRQQQVAIAQQEPLPVAITTAANDLLTQLLNQVWDTAKQAANDKVAKERQALADDRQQLETDISEALNTAEKLYQENETLKTANETMTAQIKDDDLTINGLSNEVMQYQNQIKSLESSEAALKNQVTELLATIEALKQSNAQQAVKMAEMSGALAEIEKQRDNLTVEFKKADKELKSQFAQIQAQQVLIDTKEKTITELKSELDGVKIEAKKANTKYAEISGELKAAFAENKRLNAELKKMEKSDIK